MSGRIPLVVLTAEELAELYRQRNATVLQWQPLVWKIAHKLWQHKPEVHRIGNVEDLVQVGSLAIMEAVRCYNPDYRTEDGQPVTFKTYLYRTIEQNMLREACAASLIYVPEYIRRELTGVSDRPARPEYVEQGYKALRCGHLSGYWDSPARPDYYQEDERIPFLQQAISFLQPDDRKLIIDRYGLDGQKPKTYDELARERGRTKERMRQRISRIYEKLKHHMPGNCDAGTATDCPIAS